MTTAARRPTTVVVDDKAREVRVEGRPVALTHQEFDLLRVLMANPDAAWGRSRLLEAAWKDDPYVTVRTVDVVIAALRKKFERDAEQPQYILGNPQAGYRFVDAG